MINFHYNTTLFSKDAFNEHLKLYRGYCNKTNEILRYLDATIQRKDADKKYSYYRGLKKDLSYNLNGVILHELFFKNICKDKHEPLEWFPMDDFIATAKSTRGWAICCYEQYTKSIQNILLDTHDYGLVANMYPLLVIDCYEHAYFQDYGSNVEKYINNFMNVICWDTVKRRAQVLEVE